MTREEHIYQLKQYLQGKSISMCPSSSLYWQEHWEEVIKVLEQEPILDKLYAEIEELQRDMLYASKVEFNDIYKILDKYKTESEVEDGECK